MQTELLRAVPILRELSAEDLQRFVALLAIREFKPRQRIVVEGQPMTALHIVVKGTVHVSRQAQTRTVLLSRIGACGVFGEINLFDPGVATASVDAVGDTVVAAIDYATLREYMATHPAAGYRIVSTLMGEVCRRLRQTNQRYVNAVYWTAAAAAPGGGP